jgi:serine/threonine protein phosphatase PrpC
LARIEIVASRTRAFVTKKISETAGPVLGRLNAMQHGFAVAGVRGTGQDRVRVFDDVIVLADGAGGSGNGALAARAIVDAVAGATSRDWCALLADLDRDPDRMGHAESTAVILTLDATITGASVGDSGAWLLRDSRIVDLTAGQRRKPLVGRGCVPFRIEPIPFDGTLLVASDGLFAYAKPRDIVRIAEGLDLAVATQALVDLVRLPDGALQDDVAVVLCRPA